MDQVKTKISHHGRIVIPFRFRRALGLQLGDEVVLRLEEDGLRIIAPRKAVQRAQDLVRQYVPQERSLVQDLLAERRTEGDA